MARFPFKCRSNPRIGPIQKQVRQEIPTDKKERGKQNATDDDVQVARQDSFEQKGPEPGPAHHHLNEQRTAQQRPNTETEERNQRICRGRKRVSVQ
jgi:hypothetical protein